MAEFLLEIGTEEIPARMLKRATADLKSALEQTLTEANLAFTPLEVHGAPRQLTLWGREVATRQEDREETITGPPVRIAYDGDGNPTKALLGFLRKNAHLNEDQLIHIQQKKGAVVGATIAVKGKATVDILREAIPQLLNQMHFPKNMRWGSGSTRFVRPVRNLLALLGDEVIDFEFAGARASDHSFGHRICGRASFPVTSINQYLAEKEKNGILVSHQARLDAIKAQIDAHLQSVGGALVPDEGLLREVADLVEQPLVILGSFDPMFLEIPREVLVVSLRDHQKSFSVQDESGSLMPYFLAMASMVDDPKGFIKKGNEWVLNARLWDAKFFWEADLKKDPDAMRLKLKDLMFVKSIGSYFDKSQRLAGLVEQFSQALDLDNQIREDLMWAAKHCKSDLVSDLVFEFPELQGMTGGLLMAKAGRSDTISDACYQHYLPQSMEDDLPSSKGGALVSLADKLDTLVGCFAAGLIPTGNKDPYALRRATQGIVRLLIEKELPLSLDQLLDWSIETYLPVLTLPDQLKEHLHRFFLDRLRYYLKREGYQHDLAEAVLARDTDRVDQTQKRARAILRQQEKPGFRTLALNLKRMNNVVADELDQLPDFDENRLQLKPELDLWQRYVSIKGEIETAARERDYNRAMDLMTSLAEPVEVYFDKDGVFVNTDESHIRLNRKSMLNQIRQTLGLVADISCLE